MDDLLVQVDMIICGINAELFDLTNDDEIELWYESNGDRILVKFYGIRLWDSDNDGREYLGEEIDEYEDLGNYIRKAFNNISTRLSKMIIKGEGK